MSEEGRSGGCGGGQKAHRKLRVPTHSPPPPGLPTSISKKWGVCGEGKKFGVGGTRGDCFFKIHF